LLQQSASRLGIDQNLQRHRAVSLRQHGFLVTQGLGWRWPPFKAYCCHMGTAIKHPVPDRVKPSFVIFDIRALWRSGLEQDAL